ncbi:MAG: DUF2281 domain-containing protein [Leptolyngbyaceae cyanobacterium RM2_2_4]|nr:DUF2281 domain-containing protein [Leptolyngbyaceae cyanobacterium SL_5_14]NJO52834.1 DUF2281 domain-containing protein [Leptolyngbyaceae cyanobacterium RM2_2_4]
MTIDAEILQTITQMPEPLKRELLHYAKYLIQPVILKKLGSLPELLQLKVLHYIDSLIEEQNKASEQENVPKKYRVAGTMKGMIIMSDDFDEPLEDLKDYM